jgi:hypothetical protein
MNRDALRFFSLGALAFLSVASAFADVREDLARATQPLVDGVPQVAVVRLRALLAAARGRRSTRRLSEAG